MVTSAKRKGHLAQRLGFKSATDNKLRRHRILGKLSQLWEYENTLRLGQLVSNLHAAIKPDISYTPDDRLEALIDQKLNHYRSLGDVPVTEVPRPDQTGGRQAR